MGLVVIIDFGGNFFRLDRDIVGRLNGLGNLADEIAAGLDDRAWTVVAGRRVDLVLGVDLELRHGWHVWSGCICSGSIGGFIF